MQVEEVMTGAVALINPDVTLAEAARVMREENVGLLPIGENDRLVGMVTDRDIALRAVAEERRPDRTRVREVMSKRVYTCFADDQVERAARVMARRQVRRLPVVNRARQLVGIVALADLGRRTPGVAQRALQGVSIPADEPRW